MINFHIPGLYRHLNLNFKLIKLIKTNPEYFYDNIKISGVYGSFFCPWTGGRTNDSFLDRQQKEEIINAFNELGTGVLLTYTNTLLEPRDIYDMYGNEDLELISHDPLNKVIIVSDMLKEYIHGKYPNIKFISSIASNKQGDDYEINVANANLNNTEELFNIKNKGNVEILLNSNCVKDCPYEKEHYDYISALNLSKVVKSFECPYEADMTNELHDMMKTELFISVEDLYNKYVPAGFNIFKLNGRHTGDKNALDYYLYYMVKPEYKDIVKEILEEAI